MQRRSFEQISRGERPVYKVNAPEPRVDRTELLEELNRLQKAQKKRRWRRITLLLLVLVLLASGGWYGVGYYQHRQLTNQFPASIRQSVKFPVYLPSQPQFQPDKQSFNYSNGILQYQAGSSDARVTITQQKKPADFDLSKFSTGEGLTNKNELTINGNKVLLGTVRGFSIAIMDTGQTIVTITSTSAQSSATIESVVRSLQKV